MAEKSEIFARNFLRASFFQDLIFHVNYYFKIGLIIFKIIGKIIGRLKWRVKVEIRWHSLTLEV